MASIEETERHLKELAAGFRSPGRGEEWFHLSIHDLQLKSKVGQLTTSLPICSK